jgi:phage tail tape-measure protein
MSNSKVLPVLGTVVGAAAGSVVPGIGTAAGAAIGGALGAGTQAALAKGPPAPPGLPPQVTMPDQTLIDQAKRKSIAELIQQRGRASTILTGFGDSTKLGG